MTAGFWLGVTVRVAARPSLWRVAWRQARRLARPGWRSRAPYLPLPDRDYLRFRMETQYGPGGEPAPGDVVEYLRWCADAERYAGRGPGGGARR